MGNEIAVFEQYWLHARHQEQQRLTFTTIFSVIVGGALAYLGSEHASLHSRFFVTGAIVGLSFLGFFLMHSWRISFLVYSRFAEAIMIKEFELERYKRFGIYDKLASASLIFHLFYIIIASLFFANFLLLFPEVYPSFQLGNLPINSTQAAAIGAGLLIAGMSAFYTSIFRKSEQKVIAQIKSKLVETLKKS